MSDLLDIPVLLPDLGAGDVPIRFAQWLVESGEPVMEHDRIAEVLVGGVLFHVASPAEGTLRHLVEREDTILRIGESLGYIRAVRSLG